MNGTARMGSDLHLIGTILAGLTKTESAGLYRALMGVRHWHVCYFIESFH